jgi:lipopolysaccharide/colanic/teichoic acid biosynthesis glycosyltransferase
MSASVESKNKRYYIIVKTIVDYVAALILLVVLSPLFLVISIFIARDSQGPIIYKQERLGKDGRKFMLYKFRSMNIDAEKGGAQWADMDDPRATKVGKFLRNKRLDELPQLINVLRHEMSFVGPRPEREIFHTEFLKTIPDFDKRLAVLPGITGFAQISGGYDLSPAEKLVFDLAYIENQCFTVDAKICIKTLSVIFSHEGAR